jgi:hypothetical protein
LSHFLNIRFLNIRFTGRTPRCGNMTMSGFTAV